jgi:flavin-dependent dehydrogenase
LPAAAGTWDALVVGAGPAGAVAARALARRGVRVLLVDKAQFPRWKVCGCCLNGSALRTLAELGLATLPGRFNAPALSTVRLAAGGREATLALPSGVALSRSCLDRALIDEAMAAGASFRPSTRASWVEEVPEGIHVDLHSGDETIAISPRVVLAADGLVAGFTRRIPGVRSKVAANSRIGAGTILLNSPATYPSGTIHMAIGRGGYVGLVRLEDDSLDVAAAFDASFVSDAGGLAPAACQVLDDAGLSELSALRDARWRGTPLLTRRIIPPVSRRLFLIGDAARYVEPFTGEGIAWALASGAAVVPFVDAALAGRPHADWGRHYRRMMAGRQLRCRLLTLALRRAWLTRSAIRVIRAMPQLAAPYLNLLNASTVARG